MAQTKAADNSAMKVITDKVRFSYLHVWEPVAIQEGQTKKFSVSLIIPKSNKALVKKIRDAIAAAAEAGKAKVFKGKIPANLKTPLRDGDEERPDDEAYANSFFVNANATTKPGIVDKDVNPILDQNEVYSGCYGRASINFYAFDKAGNKGIACGLNHIQKLADGEPLSGRTTADADFGGLENDDDDDDLLG